MATRSIEVTGPDESGTMTAVLPNGEMRKLGNVHNGTKPTV
jgi:hypothetical protein